MGLPKNWLINSEIEQMKRYLELTNSYFENEQKEFVEALDKRAEEFSEDEKNDFYEFYSDEYFELREGLPQRLFSSFLISWYSFMEQSLFDICDAHNLSISLKIKDNLSFGKGIRKARTFLIKGANYEIDAAHWRELVFIGQIRNRLVHEGKLIFMSFSQPSSDPYIEEERNGQTCFVRLEPNLFKYMKGHDILGFSSLFYIKPTFAYGRYLLDFGKELLDKIYSDLNPE